jgi:hypothetical protein|tara:strand:+ start:737 stop:838 length:102 start_codon:yes stop_codon:yes gene_type:complete
MNKENSRQTTLDEFGFVLETRQTTLEEFGFEFD